MNQIKLAFIGCGSHSSACLQPNIAHIPQIEFVATCDLDEEKARSCARRFGALAAYADYREMLAKENLDAVGICGPAQMHTEVGIACLDAGLHVFLEKPHAVSVQESARVCQAAERNGKLGMVATMWRHAKAYTIAKDLMGDDDFGHPILFEGYYLTPGPRQPLWGLDSLRWSHLLGQTVHPVDCMRFLMGDVTEVYAKIHERSDGVLSYAPHFQFTSGAVGTLCVTSGAAAIDMQTLVAGDKGMAVEVTNMIHVRCVRSPAWVGQGGYRDYPTHEWDAGSYYLGHARHGYIEELTHFADSILKNEQPHASLVDAHEGLRICRAIIDSDAQGAPVTL